VLIYIIRKKEGKVDPFNEIHGFWLVFFLIKSFAGAPGQAGVIQGVEIPQG
jgi:hypothetical protein